MNDIIKAVRPAESGVTIFFTICGESMGDDSAGAMLHRLLADAGLCAVHLGSRAEDAYGIAMKIKPAKAVFFDAADFGGKAGELRVFTPEQINTYSLSAHHVPLSVTAELISMDTGADVVISGVQISEYERGAEPCSAVRLAVENLAKAVISG